MRQIALLCVLVWPLAAQHVTVGAIGGVNLTPDVNEGRRTFPGGALVSDAPAPRPIIGLKLEFDFTRRWSVELDALRREVRSTQTSLISPPLQFPDGTTVSQFGPFTRTLTPWEFPVLAKYRLTATRWNPFLAAGPSFRPAGSGTGLSHFGFTAAAGLQLRAASFRIEPQIRYTRWAEKPAGFSIGAPNVNQVEFLVGLDRRSTSGAPVTAFGQPVHVGFITGIGLGTDFRVGDYNQYMRPERNSAIYGVVLEAPLTPHWSVEVNGLYRPLHGAVPEARDSTRFAHLTWEFPVLAKYRLGATHQHFRPFLEAGPSFRAEGNLNLRSVSHYGATVGGGVETAWHGLKIAPAYRYTRWAAGDASNAASQTHRSQNQLLISFTF